ncbi:MAG: ABC transporter ATP-binding protein, partial [Lutimaribacter sp.]
MNNTAPPPALRLSGVRKTYNRGKAGAIEVLRGVDLVLQRGEIVALVAPSGAGKSTLLHMAGLLDTPDAGCVEIAGQPMQGLSDRRRTLVRREDVGFVYQFHHLLPEFSALENIMLPQLAAGVGQAQARARAGAQAPHDRGTRAGCSVHRGEHYLPSGAREQPLRPKLPARESNPHSEIQSLLSC